MVFEHKGIYGTVIFDDETKTFYGKLLGVNGLVMYDAHDVVRLQYRFIDSVNEYIKSCEENGIPLFKTDKQ